MNKPRDMDDFCPPFLVIPMPLNADGDGPETDASKVAKTVWEVWDSECQSVSLHDSQKDAEVACRELRRMYDTKVAADRRRKWREDYPVAGGWHRADQDSSVLADAYLELVCADDWKPVTEELLASLGFSEYTSGPMMSLDMEWAWLECIPFDGCPEWHLAGCKMPSGPKTKGEVRHLLTSLGVDRG